MPPQLLIVEDEWHIASGLRYNLEEEGYGVDVAGDAKQARAVLERRDGAIDLVILDLMLPGESGYVLCEEWRQQGRQFPILMLTARTLTDDRIAGFEAGTDQYMTKPFDLRDLLSRIRHMLSRHSQITGAAERTAGGDEIVRFANIVVNFTTHEVSVDGSARKLTTLELKLLRVFLDSPGKVFSRTELLNKVWGIDHYPTTRTVDNFMSRLRRHFEADPSSPRFFISVRGAGYRFVAP